MEIFSNIKKNSYKDDQASHQKYFLFTNFPNKNLCKVLSLIKFLRKYCKKTKFNFHH